MIEPYLSCKAGIDGIAVHLPSSRLALCLHRTGQVIWINSVSVRSTMQVRETYDADLETTLLDAFERRSTGGARQRRQMGSVAMILNQTRSVSQVRARVRVRFKFRIEHDRA